MLLPGWNGGNTWPVPGIVTGQVLRKDKVSHWQQRPWWAVGESQWRRPHGQGTWWMREHWNRSLVWWWVMQIFEDLARKIQMIFRTRAVDEEMHHLNEQLHWGAPAGLHSQDVEDQRCSDGHLKNILRMHRNLMLPMVKSTLCHCFTLTTMIPNLESCN